MASIERILSEPWAVTGGALAVLVLVALLGAWIARRFVERGLHALAARTAGWTWDDHLVEKGVARQLSRMVPSLVVQFGIGWVPGLPPEVDQVVRNVALALTTLFGRSEERRVGKEWR